MNGKKNTFIALLMILLTGMAVPVICSAASVTTECAYTDTDVVCYIYTDPGLRSAGVKLFYNTAELNTPVVTKNDTDWYFGTTTVKHAYMDPENTTPGEVVYITGKMDTGALGDGACPTCTRALVGTATFGRKTATDPGPDPETFFGISTGLGRDDGPDGYVNFVSTDGTDLDSPFNSTTTAGVRGDTDGNGVIDFTDLFTIRNIIVNAEPYSVLADCQADGVIDFSDLFCVRNIILNP